MKGLQTVNKRHQSVHHYETFSGLDLFREGRLVAGLIFQVFRCYSPASLTIQKIL
jgi:hypothetical protein